MSGVKEIKIELGIVLVMKTWTKYFTQEELYLVLAETLNETILTTKMKLVGYMLYQKRIYLIVESQHNDEDKFVKVFVKLLSQKLSNLAIDRNNVEKFLKERANYKDPMDLFYRYPLDDHNLKLLLKGEVPNLGYYDPKLEMTKNFLRHYNYSSFKNYHHEKGPVLMFIHAHV
jgi:hypothetical protein